MTQHALLSPSGFKALMLCPAKPAMERGRPDDSSEYADEGTAAHFLGAHCLTHEAHARDYLGRRIVVYENGECAFFTEDLDLRGSRQFLVDDSFAQHVQTYVELVREYHLGNGDLLVEQALPIDHITDEDGAEGTGDAVIVREDEIIVVDLKFGRGVEVTADDNPQLKLYALGALRKFDLVGDVERIVMVICQPRAGGRSEATCTVDELREWARTVAIPAANTAMLIYQQPDEAVAIAKCNPHEDACRFCKARGDCPALDRFAQDAIGREFTDLTTASEPERDAIVQGAVTTAAVGGQLGAKMDAVPLLEIFCKAVRARVEKELLEGREVAGYKLVAGKKGARAWSDEADAEKALKAMRLKKEQMYAFSVISPTAAEKLLKPTPKRWAKLQPLIKQTEGKPSVAPLTDKREALAIQPVASEFTPITESSTADDLV